MEDDGLFDESRIEDERFDALPPPRSPGEDNADPFGDGENGEVSKLADVPEAKRKGVKRPQPKLDSNRLISERGLPVLRTLFNDVKFKGKGHEADDLRSLMKRMENWAHRLFPKLQFEDFIDKVERLGAKKEVQTCLKRIRLDMPLTHEDYTSTTQEGEEEVPADLHIFGDPDPFGGEHLSASTPRMTHSTPGPSAFTAQSVDPSLGSSPSSQPSPLSLTEEQQKRMAENRLKALERRLARQKQQAESQSMEFQSTQAEPSETQTRESEPVPMEESTEVPPEPDQSPDQVQNMNKDEKQDQDQDPMTNSSTQPQKHPQSQDSEKHVESTPDPREPEASPSPVPEPEENQEEE